MPDLPTGTVTFVFADMEGSTRLLQQLGDRYVEVLDAYRRLLRAAMREEGGSEVNAEGDAFVAAFPRANAAVRWAVAAQRSILAYPWPGDSSVRVRMGLHTGEPVSTTIGYVGIVVHLAARIGAAGHGGQVLVSQTTADLVGDSLSSGISLKDVGTHRLKDLAQPQRLFQIVAAGLPGDFPPLKSLDARPNNLPVQLTSFVGREREKGEIKGLFATTRLLTLTGSGGAGKTRLALQVAAELLEDYPDGVWCAELDSLSQPALVPQTVAAALRVPEQPGRPVAATLADALRHKRLLLVLDNCEHLVAACADLVEPLLRACPHLQILATSREALGVRGETVWRVPSLSLPHAGHLPSTSRLSDYEAVRLFIERSLTSQPHFAVTDHNAGAIVQTCSRLDGIPLAIELAAARVKVLAVEQIAARLDDRFRLLTGGSRTVLPRQQTLRAAMDWSYDLLSDAERTVLRRLSVFAGGWTLDAAEAICSGGDIRAADMLDLLAQLAAKSLLLVETPSGEARYQLLETVREYGRGRLIEAGEAAGVRHRHLDWYLDLAERAEPELQGPSQAAWLRRLETEHDNLRVALEWSTADEGGAAKALRLAGALSMFWHVRGHFSEGRGWLENVLRRSQDTPPSARAKGLAGAGFLAWRQSDYEAAVGLYEESLALFRTLNDVSGMAQALYALGMVAEMRGDYDRAKALLTESLTSCREKGDTRRAAIALNSLGEVARCQDDFAEARAFYEQSLQLRREVGDERGIAITLANLGHVALHQGEPRNAATLFRQALGIARDIEYKLGIAEYVAGLGGVAVAEGRADRAARLLGAAEGLLTALGARLDPPDQAEYERSVEAARAALEASTLARALGDGRAMSPNEAVHYALLQNDDASPAPSPPARNDR